MNKKEAIQFIKECALSGKVIIGIERFHYTDGKKVPDLSNIADFSGSGHELSIISATNFIRSAPDGHFEFTSKEENN